jgi:hypothetical protein
MIYSKIACIKKRQEPAPELSDVDSNDIKSEQEFGS